MIFVSAGITPEFNARRGPPSGERRRGTIAAPMTGPVLRRMQQRAVGARVAERITHTCATVREDVLTKMGLRRAAGFASGRRTASRPSRRYLRAETGQTLAHVTMSDISTPGAGIGRLLKHAALADLASAPAAVLCTSAGRARSRLRIGRDAIRFSIRHKNICGSVLF